jgi:hypothetical protein
MSVFGFDGGPTYRGATRQEMFESAMAQPMSVPWTLFDQAKGGALESFGLGTAIKDFTIPEGAPTTQSRIGDAFRLVNPLTTGYEITRRTAQAFREDSPALSEDAYKTSPYFRDDIPWDAGMTEDRAAALAMGVDARKVREFYAAKRPIWSFVGNMAGQALDPINYVPVGGPAVKAAAVARAGRIGGTALAGALDAAGNTAIFSIATRDRRASYGDDVSWQATVSEIATAALIGGAFGAIGGAWGGRADAKSRQTIEDRLATLKTTQEARIALNEAIGGLARGEDVALSPNATEPLARVAREVDELSRAYDRSIADVRAGLAGDKFDPIVHVTPEDIEGSFVARGGYKGKGDIEVRGAGYGLVKFAVKHGELSSKPEGEAITKQDIMDFPDVIRSFEPFITEERGVVRRNWVVEKADGRTVVYGDRPIAERGGERGLVTVHVEPGRQISPRRSPGEPAKGSTGDTDLASFARAPDRPVGAILPATAISPQAPAGFAPEANVARPIAVDNSAPRPEPIPEDRQPAETRIAKPDDYKAMSAQYGVDPEAGTFVEEADVQRVRTEGRLTADDEADLADAQAAFEDGKAYGEALKSVVGCLL